MPGVEPTQMGAQPPEGGQGAPSGTPSGDGAKPSGDIELARANVMIAVAHLEKQLPMLGTDSEEGKALLSALSTLSKKFSGKKSEDLAPAELMQLMASQPDQVKQAIMREMAASQQKQAGPDLGGPGPQSSPLKLS